MSLPAAPNAYFARAIVTALAADPEALDHLRRLGVETHGRGNQEGTSAAYTVVGLAHALGVTARVVRNAIARGELPAVKRGGRWYMAADAVAAWTHEEPSARAAPRRPSAPATSAADARHPRAPVCAVASATS